jgi:hypothetical protein
VLVEIHRHPWLTVVLGEDLSIAPSVIVDGHDVVLEKADHLTAGEGGFLSFGIEDLQGGIIVEDLIHAVTVNLVPETAEGIPGVEDPDQKLCGIVSEERIKDRR